jgi:hypothetical protein
LFLAFPRYEGLSEVFLSCPVPKLLLLAGTDRLDRYCSPVPYEKFLKVKESMLAFGKDLGH